MPDHLHAVAEGSSDATDFRAFVRDFKQRSAFTFKQRTSQRLWQPSFHDRILRDAESTADVVCYVLYNPVRAGLVSDARDYPHLGSDVYAVEDLIRSL
jgi:putative transposase